MQLLGVRCDGVDRRLGYAASVVAASSFAVLWVPNLSYRAPNGATGPEYLALGTVLSGLVGVATLSGRRLLLACALLLVALGPWGPEQLFQLLYVLVAVVTAARTLLGAANAAGPLVLVPRRMRRRAGAPRRTSMTSYLDTEPDTSQQQKGAVVRTVRRGRPSASGRPT